MDTFISLRIDANTAETLKEATGNRSRSEFIRAAIQDALARLEAKPKPTHN